ncbi:YdeI/OmpD-associated family protein [Cognataquiflexum aquatile]|uniref:YdeI/OmpD-associated family protein n=1 Tax=Cognataquiflexum aquatile TaxID=2249427 RepID=UPI000DEB936A|nr:YdeI/OmpD-associated family protein [Cognataquiflexum aquatile]
MISFLSTLEDFHTNLWKFHLPVPEDIAAQFINGDNRRVRVHLGGIPVFPAALMKTKEYWFILLNKPNREKLKIAEGDKITMTLEKDNSEYGHDMPEEMQVLLDQDEVGSRYFYSLTKGKQRGLIYIVTKVKNTNSRLNKSLAIIEHLKDVKGKLEYKLLNEKIKYYNNLDNGW